MSMLDDFSKTEAQLWMYALGAEVRHLADTLLRIDTSACISPCDRKEQLQWVRDRLREKADRIDELLETH